MKAAASRMPGEEADMEWLLAGAVGVLTTAGVYLLLRARIFAVALGFTLLSYAANLYLFAMGRLAVGAPPLIDDHVARYADPLPQALVSIAILVALSMTALIAAMALRSCSAGGGDHVDDRPPPTGPEEDGR